MLPKSLFDAAGREEFWCSPATSILSSKYEGMFKSLQTQARGMFFLFPKRTPLYTCISIYNGVKFLVEANKTYTVEDPIFWVIEENNIPHVYEVKFSETKVINYI